MTQTATEVAFQIVGVSKEYPGVKALSNVTLTGYRGEVLAICGANGAGKSTLAKMIAGQEQPSAGQIRVEGYDSNISSPSNAEDAGILLMHQEPVIIDTFTVAENVFLKELSGADHVRPWNLVSKKKTKMAGEALAAVGLGSISPSAAASALTPGLRQMLAMSRTQVNPHKILLLDETTASTTEDHFQDVLALVRKERSDGTSIIFVSHRMQEVFSMSDRIAVLRGGMLVGVRNTKETSHDEIMNMMVGKTVAKLHASENGPGEDVAAMVKVRGLASGSAEDIDFDVRPGEIVGLYGLVGSGRSSIARSISGQQDRDAGKVEINGRVVHPKTPRQALAVKIAYATENRRKDGFTPDFSNGHNITLATLGKYARFGVLNLKYEARRVDELITKYQIKGTGTTLTADLSGGNQQKVCLAKWLETDPELIVLDEPTKGIDVGARTSVYQIIRAVAELGKAVVVVSSEAEEIMMLCHRTLIIRAGAIVDCMTPEHNTIDDVIRASLRGKKQ